MCTFAYVHDLNDLFYKYIFKKIIIDIYIIKSQKQDLSYTHILLIINHDNKIKDIEDINNIIYIEILDYNINSDLYDIIINIMIHDSCDSI